MHGIPEVVIIIDLFEIVLYIKEIVYICAMETFTFHELPPLQLINGDLYNESCKQLSFLYRDLRISAPDGILAFIALKDENAPIEDAKGVGCHVLGYYVNCQDENGGISSGAVCLDDKLFEEAIDRIKQWKLDSDFKFDYYWFNVSDNLEFKEFVESTEEHVIVDGDIAYVIINR